MLDTVDDYIKHDLVHSIHTTGRRSFRSCRRRWAWIFRDFYYPTVTAKPLEFGVAFHKAMETLYDPATWDKPDLAFRHAKAVFKGTVEEQCNAFKKQQGHIDPEQQADYDERVKLGLGMLHYYYTKVMKQYDFGQFKPVSVEQKFEVPITGPNDQLLWCKCNACWDRYVAWGTKAENQTKGTWPDGRIGIKIVDKTYGGKHWRIWQGLPVTYGGRIDALFEDEYRYYWILDWKTAAQLTKDDNDDYLLLEDQITSYVWALRKILGLPIAGFIYAEIKKGVPEEPEPLKRPYRGRLYSTNKQSNFEAESFRRTVEENDPYAYAQGLYDEFLEYLEGEGSTLYHRRHQVNRNDKELEAAGYNI